MTIARKEGPKALWSGLEPGMLLTSHLRGGPFSAVTACTHRWRRSCLLPFPRASACTCNPRTALPLLLRAPSYRGALRRLKMCMCA